MEEQAHEQEDVEGSIEVLLGDTEDWSPVEDILGLRRLVEVEELEHVLEDDQRLEMQPM